MASPARNLMNRCSIAAIGLLFAGCATTGGSNANNEKLSKEDYRNAIEAYSSQSQDPSGMDPVAAAAYWGTRYNKNQNDPSAAVQYSAALRRMGSVDQATAVMLRAAAANPGDVAVNFETGKALIEAGRGFEAVRYLEYAATAQDDEWRVLSAYGVALDQIGEHAQARIQYDRALQRAPGAVQVLNNKALSFALDQNLKLAERTLRVAVASPGATARTRQNLALVLALRGEMSEAERLARSDLPPRVADQNVNYYRNLIAQPAYWAQYAPQDFDTPAFSDEDPIDAAPMLKQPAPEPAPTPNSAPTIAPMSPDELRDKSQGGPIADADDDTGAVDVTPTAADTNVPAAPLEPGGPEILTP